MRPVFSESSGGSRWQTKTNVRTRFVLAHHNQAVNIAARRVKVLAIRLNSIAIVATMSVAAIFNF
jgi:hypothetical protein